MVLEEPILDIGGGDGTFATVTLIELLEHLYDPLSLLKECTRIGKTVVLSVPNFNYLKDRLYMLGGRIPPRLNPKNGHIHWFNHTVLQRMLDEADLEAESAAFIAPKRFLPKFVWRVLGRLMPNLFVAGYVVKCKNKKTQV